GQGRLRQVRGPGGVGYLDFLGFLPGADELDRPGRLAERSDRLVVLLVADQDDRVVLPRVVDRLQVHLRDERAGGVDRLQLLAPRRVAHRRGHAVGRIDQPRGIRHFVDFLDEDRALGAQLVHDVSVVDDLLADVDLAVADLEGPLDDVDRPDDAGAEAAQARDQELLDPGVRRGGGGRHQVTVSASFSSLLRPRPPGAAARPAVWG